MFNIIGAIVSGLFVGALARLFLSRRGRAGLGA